MDSSVVNYKNRKKNKTPEKSITIHISFSPRIEDIIPKIKNVLENIIGFNSNTDVSDEILTPDDLASIWKVPKSKIYGLTMKTGPGSIPRFKIGRHLRFKRSEIDRWAAKQDIK